MSEYVNPEVLVSDEELEGKLGDPSIRLVEVDEDTTLYAKGHIPGAIAWNWKTDLHDPLRRDFLPQSQLSVRKSRRSGSCRSVFQFQAIAPGMWPLAYRVVSSSTSTSRIDGSPSLPSSSSSETRTSGFTYSDIRCSFLGHRLRCFTSLLAGYGVLPSPDDLPAG